MWGCKFWRQDSGPGRRGPTALIHTRSKFFVDTIIDGKIGPDRAKNIPSARVVPRVGAPTEVRSWVWGTQSQTQPLASVGRALRLNPTRIQSQTQPLTSMHCPQNSKKNAPPAGGRGGPPRPPAAGAPPPSRSRDGGWTRSTAGRRGKSAVICGNLTAREAAAGAHPRGRGRFADHSPRKGSQARYG
eukprot:gene24879-biopygen5970